MLGNSGIVKSVDNESRENELCLLWRGVLLLSWGKAIPLKMWFSVFVQYISKYAFYQRTTQIIHNTLNAVDRYLQLMRNKTIVDSSDLRVESLFVRGIDPLQQGIVDSYTLHNDRAWYQRTPNVYSQLEYSTKGFRDSKLIVVAVFGAVG